MEKRTVVQLAWEGWRMSAVGRGKEPKIATLLSVHSPAVAFPTGALTLSGLCAAGWGEGEDVHWLMGERQRLAAGHRGSRLGLQTGGWASVKLV